jgi:hypothetical protein
MTEGPGFDRRTHKIEWISARNISVVWTNAQQPYDEKHAKQIADGFDPDMFDPIKVTLPNGNGIYHAIDGQHRVGAIKLLWGENEKVPCEVIGEADPARAAQLFININTGRKRPTPLSIFRVSVTAGDETAVAVNEIAARLGYQIENAHQSKNILAVAALCAVYRQCGPQTLENTLKIIQATWGMDPNAVVAQIIRGYGAFMVEYGDKANWQRLKEVIAKKYTPGRFIGAAKTSKEVNGGNMADAIKKLLLANYNKGFPAVKHLKPKGS